jgi:hypothetical protein
MFWAGVIDPRGRFLLPALLGYTSATLLDYIPITAIVTVRFIC